MGRRETKDVHTLPDYIRPGLRVLFVGINPGIRSAAVGHHFAGPSNRFWKLLYGSGLVDEPLTYRDDWRLPEWGLGLTNMIQRPTAGIESLTRREYGAGGRRLLRVVRRHRPCLVALLGVTIYRSLFVGNDGRPVSLGLQCDRFAGARVFLLPNPSGRNAHYSYGTMLKTFRTLRKEADAE